MTPKRPENPSDKVDCLEMARHVFLRVVEGIEERDRQPDAENGRVKPVTALKDLARLLPIAARLYEPISHFPGDWDELLEHRCGLQSQKVGS